MAKKPDRFRAGDRVWAADTQNPDVFEATVTAVFSDGRYDIEGRDTGAHFGCYATSEEANGVVTTHLRTRLANARLAFDNWCNRLESERGDRKKTGDKP